MSLVLPRRNNLFKKRALPLALPLVFSMIIPSNINSIIQRILESEAEWKALYMGVWGCAFFYLKPLNNTELWEQPLNFGLPASKKKFQEYTPARLYEILTSKGQ